MSRFSTFRSSKADADNIFIDFIMRKYFKTPVGTIKGDWSPGRNPFHCLHPKSQLHIMVCLVQNFLHLMCHISKIFYPCPSIVEKIG